MFTMSLPSESSDVSGNNSIMPVWNPLTNGALAGEDGAWSPFDAGEMLDDAGAHGVGASTWAKRRRNAEEQEDLEEEDDDLEDDDEDDDDDEEFDDDQDSDDEFEDDSLDDEDDIYHDEDELD